MYKIAFSVFRKSLPLLVLCTFTLTILGYLTDRFAGPLAAEIIVLIILVAHFHRSILTGKEMTAKDLFRFTPLDEKLITWGFTWRFLALLVLPGICYIWSGWQLFQGNSDLETNSSLTALKMSAIGVIVGTLIFVIQGALVGTILPAAAIAEDASLRRALSRAKLTTWKTVWRLLYGPVAWTILWMALVLATFLIPGVLSIFENTAAEFAYNFALSVTGYFTPVLTASALSMAYQSAEEKLTQQANAN